GETLRADVDALNATDYYTDRLLGLWVAEDLNDTSLYRPYLMQGGLGMPDREYYLSAETRYVELRGKYKAHVASMLRLAGVSEAELRPDRLRRQGPPIAKAHWTVDQGSDVSAATRVWSRAELARRGPGLGRLDCLPGAGLGGGPSVGA